MTVRLPHRRETALSLEEHALLLRLADWHSRCDGTPTADLSEEDWRVFLRLQSLGLATAPTRSLFSPPIWVDITEAGLREALP